MSFTLLLCPFCFNFVEYHGDFNWLNGKEGLYSLYIHEYNIIIFNRSCCHDSWFVSRDNKIVSSFWVHPTPPAKPQQPSKPNHHRQNTTNTTSAPKRVIRSYCNISKRKSTEQVKKEKKTKQTMLSPNRLVLWSLVVGLFLSNAGVTAAQAVPEAAAPLEDAEIVPEQRRQLWDFFSLLQMGK